MTRKIIQIAIMPEGETLYPQQYIVCDDGTAWCRSITKRGEHLTGWVLIEAPHDDAEIITLLDLREAVHNSGISPEFHKLACEQLKRGWPELWNAIVILVGEPKL